MDWLILPRLPSAFSAAASLRDSWTCCAASFAFPQVSLTAPLGLVDHSLVGEFFVADDLSDVLLDLSNSLVNFSSNLILIHGSSLFTIECVYSSVKYPANRPRISIARCTLSMNGP
jgi:hypothetical protein